MKRLGFVFAFGLVGLMLAGCGSGLKEGTATEIPKSSMPDSHKAFMEKNAGKMNLMKGRPKNAAGPPGRGAPQ